MKVEIMNDISIVATGNNGVESHFIPYDMNCCFFMYEERLSCNYMYNVNGKLHYSLLFSIPLKDNKSITLVLFGKVVSEFDATDYKKAILEIEKARSMQITQTQKPGSSILPVSDIN